MSFFFKSRKNHHNNSSNSKDKDKDRDKDKSAAAAATAADLPTPIAPGPSSASPITSVSAAGPPPPRGHNNSISTSTSAPAPSPSPIPSPNPAVAAAAAAAAGRSDSPGTPAFQSAAAAPASSTTPNPYGHHPSPSLQQLSNAQSSANAGPQPQNQLPGGPPQPPPGMRSRSASNAASSPLMIPGGFPRAMGSNDSANTSLRSIEEVPSPPNGQMMNLPGGQAQSLPTMGSMMMPQPPPFAEGRKRGESISRMGPPPGAPPLSRPPNGPPMHNHPPMRPPPPQNASDPSPYPWSQRRLILPSVPGPDREQVNLAGPFPRYGAAVNCNASKEGDIYLMGGIVDGNVVQRDLWMIEGAGASLVLTAAKGDASVVGINGLVGMPCYPVSSVTAGPGPRIGHRSLLVGNAFIVFGGDTKSKPDDALDDTLYLLNTSSRQWSRAIPPGPRPRGRYGHTMNIVGSKIYIFGGQNDKDGFFNDLICFDLNALQKASNHWQFLIENTGDSESGEIPIDENTGKPTIPPARTNHTMVAFNDRLWLFGGTDGVHWFNDAWVYDPRTNTWQSIDYVGVTPTPREGHAAAMVGDIMYVFGGRNSDGDDLDDLVAFRCTQRRWYTFQKMGPAPSPRSGHAMSVFGRWIVVIGGGTVKGNGEDEELELVYVLDTGKIRYPDSPPMHGPPGANTPGHLMHPAHQRTASPHGVALQQHQQQQDRGRDSNAAAMQRRMMSPTRAIAGPGGAPGPGPGPGPGPNADGQYTPFTRPGSEQDAQQARRGPMPPQHPGQGQPPGPLGPGGRPLPPGQRPRGPGSFSTSPQPANTPPRSPQPGTHAANPSVSMSNVNGENGDGQDRPASQQQQQGQQPPSQHTRRTSRSVSASPSPATRHTPSSSQSHIQPPVDEGWSVNMSMSTEPIQEVPEDSDEEQHDQQQQQQHQSNQSQNQNQGLPAPQHPRSSSAASNGTSPTPRQSRSPAPIYEDSKDDTESQNGSISNGVTGKPLHNNKASSRLGSITSSRTGSPAEQQQQPQPNRPRRVSSAQAPSTGTGAGASAGAQNLNAAGPRQNAVPEIEVAAPHVENDDDNNNESGPTYAAVTAVGAGAAAAAAAGAGAGAPRHAHQQSQGSRRTPSNATSLSNYTTNSGVSAATTLPANQRDSTHNNGQGSSLQRHGSNASGTRVAARAMEAGEAAPLVRTPSGHRRSRTNGLGSVGSVGSRSRDSMYSVGAPGPATHDGGEIEDSMLSVTLGPPASSSSNSSGTSLQQQQQQQQQQQPHQQPASTTPEAKRNSRRISASDWDAPKSPRLTPHQEALMKELDAVKRKNAWFAGELALARKAGYVPSSITPPVSSGPAALAADRFRSVSHGSTSSFGSSFGGTLSNADSESFGGAGNAGAGPTSAALSKHASLHGLNALEQDSAGLKDEDKPLLEALLAMRAELITMQSTVEQQASTAARKVAEVEQQRDIAVREAVYAQAKLAALGGGAAVSRSGTAMSDNSRSATPTNAVSAKEKELREKDFDSLHAERATDMSRRLALALVGQNDMKQRVDTLTAELKEEQHARQIAEELREATSQRLSELESKNRDLVELESLRAEITALHDALNEQQTAKAHAESQMKLAEIDKRELEDKLEEAELLASGSADNFAALREAVFASEEKASHVAKQLAEAEEREEVLGQQLREARAAVEEKTVHVQDMERQIAESTDMAQMLQKRSEEDRLTREDLEKQLLDIKTERDAIIAESEETRRKLRDASEIAEKHAREAETHRAAFLAGLNRMASSRNLKGSVAGGSDAGSEHHHPISDERVSALRDQVDRANERAQAQQEAAEAATEKLRRAEERIAGLEAYQEQSAREGLQLRRQLQVATREARILALEIRDVKAQLETQQRDANALLVQHNALKELLNDRNVHYSDSTRRSPRLESPASNSNPSRFGTPEHSRLRELEQQLQASIKAHEDTKASFEQREQEAEKTYNEKLEQLGKDYRSAVHYVKGTEKMLRRMKDELEKYKTQNAKFQSELETVGRQSSSSEYSSRAAAEWETERAHLQSALADAQDKMSSAVVELESQVSKLHEDVAAARAERDKARRAEEALEQELYELSEKSRTEIARLRSENAALEGRASDAERRVMVLLESSIQAQQAQGLVRRTQSNASSDTIGRILSRSRGNSVSTLSREIDTDAENVPLRSHSAAAATNTPGGLRPIMPGNGDHPVDQRTSLALDSLTSELDALRSHWEASNRRCYRLSSNTLDPDREDLSRAHDGFGNGGEDGKEEPLVLSESLVGWRKKLEEEEQRASMAEERQSAGSRTPVGASGNAGSGNPRSNRDVESPVMPVGVTVTADNMI